ncbi:Ribokinase-like protein [Dentipellis sp. KUC8613]|nr:Ribokinase-like protein [Dentipellis sp. KUC8613]
MSAIKARCLVRGSINVDEFFHVKEVVRPGETIASTQFERRGGGKGANQAAAVARAGGSVALVGAVGEDGRWHRDDLGKFGVSVDQVSVVQTEPTGRAIIQLTSAGENCIILYKGANFALTESPADIQARLTGITHLLLQNEIPWDTTVAYLTQAHKQGTVTVFNPSPMPSDAQLHGFPWASLSWLLVNEVEIADLLNALEGQHVADIQDPLSNIRRLSAHPRFSPAVNVVCTLGAAGVLMHVPSIPEPIKVPAAKLQGTVRDTTGAGDCFTGYLVAELMRAYERGASAQLSREELVNVVKLCAQAAGMCVEKRGAMESIPLREEVEKRLSEV